MEIEFTEKHLRELYEEGKSLNKKYRFQKDIITRYKNTIDKLRAANKIEDLFTLNSLNYEKLSNTKENLESVRVNNKYRIIFTSRTEGEEPNIITICDIIELSNHYDKKK